MPIPSEQYCSVQVKFGHRVVFTLLEESAIEREWRGSDGISRSSFFRWVPRPAVGRYRKALEAMVREFSNVPQKLLLLWYDYFDYFKD